MVQKLILFYLIGFFTFSLPSAQAADRKPYYRVQAGDQLGRILQKLRLKPIYSKIGSLQRTLEENPNKIPTQGNLIYPDEKIYFSETDLKKIRKKFRISSYGRIFVKKRQVTKVKKQLKRAIASQDAIIDQHTPSDSSIPYSKQLINSETSEDTRIDSTAGISEVSNEISKIEKEVADQSVVQTSEPTTKLDQADEENLIQWNRVRLQAGVNYIVLEGINSDENIRGLLGSSGSPSLKLDWSLFPSEKFSLDFGAYYQTVKMGEAARQEILNQEQSLAGFYLGGQYYPTSRIQVGIHGGYFNRLYYRQVGTNSFQVEKNFVPAIKLSLGYQFYQSKKIQLKIGGEYQLSLPVSNEIFPAKIGSGYRGFFTAEYSFPTTSIFSEAFYETLSLKAGSTQFIQSQIGLQFGARIDIGR